MEWIKKKIKKFSETILLTEFDRIQLEWYFLWLSSQINYFFIRDTEVCFKVYRVKSVNNFTVKEWGISLITV